MRYQIEGSFGSTRVWDSLARLYVTPRSPPGGTLHRMVLTTDSGSTWPSLGLTSWATDRVSLCEEMKLLIDQHQDNHDVRRRWMQHVDAVLRHQTDLDVNIRTTREGWASSAQVRCWGSESVLLYQRLYHQAVQALTQSHIVVLEIRPHPLLREQHPRWWPGSNNTRLLDTL